MNRTDPYWAQASFWQQHSIAANEVREQYWLLFDSQTDVITLLDSQTLSTALQRNATNLGTLVQVLTAHIFALLSQPDFPRPPSSSHQTQWLGSSRDKQDQVDLAKEALNCVRVLARVVPFLYLSYKDQSASLEHSLFWKRQRVPPERKEADFVIDDEDENGQDWEEVPPLSERLLAALVDLLFVPGFTIAEEYRTEDSCIAHVIWQVRLTAN